MLARFHCEPLDLWHFLARDLVEATIRVRLDFAARLDVAALRQALELCLRSCPLLATRFQSGFWRCRWVAQPSLSHDWLRVAPAGGGSGGSGDSGSSGGPACFEAVGPFEAAVAAAFAGGLDVTAGPQVRVTLVRGPEGDSLVLLVSHQAMDAAGLKDFMTEFGRLYTAIARGQTPRPAPPQTRSLTPILRTLPWRRRLRLLPTAPNSRGRDRSPGIERAAGPGRTVVVRIGEADFAAARRAAKALGGTVNHLLLAVAGRAACARAGLDHVDLPFTVDLRQFAPATAQFGPTNLVANAWARVPGSGSLPDAVRAVAAGTADVRERDELWAGLDLLRFCQTAFPSYFIRRTYGASVKLQPFLFTNSGIWPRECVTFGEPAYQVTASAGFKPSPALQINAITFDGALQLTASVQADEAGAAEVEALLQAMADDLVDLGRTAPGAAAEAAAAAAAEPAGAGRTRA
ncbi:MAG: hypothetical protein LBR33_11975 [Propionibacteriaceae bacterium]|jgi:NRPS condensation-like uncharacterized protein|nr:hypothetical protein [Propionibacteriaceae bacterium]